MTAQNLKAGYVSSASSARSACQLKYEMDRFLIKKGQKITQKPDEQTDSVASGVDEGNKSEDKNQQEDIGEGTGRETAGVIKKRKNTEAYKMSTENFKRSGEVDGRIPVCFARYEPSMFDLQTNPCRFQTKQSGAPFQNGASKIQGNVPAWQ